MKLTDLQPRWWVRGDTNARVGISFACPCHVAGGLNEYGSADCAQGRVHVPTERAAAGPGDVWSRTGEDFASMTLAPSVKVSVEALTHWHGHVTNGEVSILPDSTAPAWPEGWVR